MPNWKGSGPASQTEAVAGTPTLSVTIYFWKAAGHKLVAIPGNAKALSKN
jgi:hypothetical protein